MKTTLVPMVLLLAACGSATPEAEAPTRAPAAVRPPAPPGPPGPVAGVALKDVSDLLSYEWRWPSAAAAIPALDARLRAAAAAARTEALAGAREDKAAHGDDGFFNRHERSAAWTVAGDTPGLLSLRAEQFEFTGGAHGMTTYEALLWDRAGDRPLAFADLFTDPAAAMRTLTPAYCSGLDAARAEKRGPDAGAGAGWQTDCPALTEQTLVPSGRAGRPFDRVTAILAPYAAGSFAEGAYEVDLPVTPALLASMKPAWRASFAAGGVGKAPPRS